MTTILLPIASLLLSVAILLVGHGLQLTLLPLRGQALGWSASEIGVTGSAYFLGFVVGCLAVPRLVTRVGHIRVFAVLAAIATAALLGIVLVDSVSAWAMLRFLTGCALSGLYMVIESWLNERAPSRRRGLIMALYQSISLLAIGGGQFLIRIAAPTAALPFVLGAILISLSIIPVGLTRAAAPPPVRRVRFRPRKLFRTSQVAFAGAVGAGMLNGAFWGLGPIYAGRVGLPITDVSLFMSAAVFGGAALQFPFGYLSDRFDRRNVVLGLAIAGGFVSMATATFGGLGGGILSGLAFLFGATAMPLYALCVAHANDNTRQDEFVETSSGILMLYSVGSVFGPLLAAQAMGAFGPGSLFAFAGVCFFAVAAWTAFRIGQHEVPREHAQAFVSMTHTTQQAFELDPRSEEEVVEPPAAATQAAE